MIVHIKIVTDIVLVVDTALVLLCKTPIMVSRDLFPLINQSKYLLDVGIFLLILTLMLFCIFASSNDKKKYKKRKLNNKLV